MADLAHTFQTRVDRWMQVCFPQTRMNMPERYLRFLEEAVELVQAYGCPMELALRMVEHVYAGKPGEPFQETGGVVVTLSALCTRAQVDLVTAAEDELARIWLAQKEIRAKDARKLLHGVEE